MQVALLFVTLVNVTGSCSLLLAVRDSTATSASAAWI